MRDLAGMRARCTARIDCNASLCSVSLICLYLSRGSGPSDSAEITPISRNRLRARYETVFLLEYLRLVQEMPSKSSSIELADTASELMNGVAGWLLIGLGVAGVLSGTGGIIQQAGTADIIAPIIVAGFAVLFIISGVLVNPRFRRRLDRRHRPSRFGRVKTVESRTRSATDEREEPCVVCGSRSKEGLVRRYRQEYVVAGVPLRTISENHTFYCPDCALAELSGYSTSSADERDTEKRMITETE